LFSVQTIQSLVAIASVFKKAKIPKNALIENLQKTEAVIITGDGQLLFVADFFKPNGIFKHTQLRSTCNRLKLLSS
jgi:hypothetical protein